MHVDEACCRGPEDQVYNDSEARFEIVAVPVGDRRDVELQNKSVRSTCLPQSARQREIRKVALCKDELFVKFVYPRTPHHITRTMQQHLDAALYNWLMD